jgi:hypothetical protein
MTFPSDVFAWTELTPEDVLRVRFRVDDPHRTMIDRPVEVRYCDGEIVGVRFFR